MFSKLFTIIINLIATVIQLVLWPLNQGISLLFPDLSSTITNLSSTLVSLFSNLGWAIGLIPSSLRVILALIITLEIAKHSMYLFAHGIVKAWNLLQKIKFW